jgi:peptidoglycan-associated lipoprotein
VADPGSISEEETFRRKSLDQLNAEHPLADVFFDYDGATLRDEGRAALQQDAAWLLKWKQTAINIAGHCDERGTAEYNLALGERRAAAARTYLIALGVDSKRITVTSFGREKPFCTDSNEGCWSQNRRGHFRVTAK